jgi:hypothetical protein
MIRPQPGFQEQALATPADIAIIGGSAGSGKSFVLLMESARHTHVKGFGAVLFRRTTPQITNEGALWDTSQTIFPLLNASPNQSLLRWTFPSGAKIKFSHLEHEKNVLDWQGSQIPMIGFDELTHFTENQFWYMVSRNRTDCGVRPYIRATCNPDPDSWVAKFIAWWIDQKTGFPIPEHAGKIRYCTRDNGVLVWGDTVQEVVDQCPHIFKNEALLLSGVDVSNLVKSVTFIPGSIYENKVFIKKDPGYLGSLLSLQEEERKRLLEGNWLVRLDGMGLCNFDRLQTIFSNWPETAPNALKCITCDPSRFGKDFGVIMVWKGWQCVYLVVYKKADTTDFHVRIEYLRRKFNVMRDDVLVDQDGVGGGLVKLGNYTGFHGGARARRDPDVHRIKENYFNLKTQCAYRFAEMHVNTGAIRYDINSETCEIYEDGMLAPVYTTRMKHKGEIVDVRDLLVQDLRSYKRDKDHLDPTRRITMISKEEQKNILGRSPDFGDCSIMREYFELRGLFKGMEKAN